MERRGVAGGGSEGNEVKVKKLEEGSGAKLNMTNRPKDSATQ